MFGYFYSECGYLCNENQLDALFILNLFHQTTSTCFGHIYWPSSGGIHCICTAVGTCYSVVCLGDWQLAGSGWNSNTPEACRG
jgi:hypothetical protein